MKKLLAVSLTLASVTLAAQTAQAEDLLNKIGRVAQQTSEGVQEAKDRRDILTGEKSPEQPASNESSSSEPRKVVREKVEEKSEKLKKEADEKGREVENHGREISAEKQRLNAERKAQKEKKKKQYQEHRKNMTTHEHHDKQH